VLLSGPQQNPPNNEEASVSIEATRTVMTRYFESAHGDASMMADDVVFTIMATGQSHTGRDGVLQMLRQSLSMLA